MPWPSLLLGLVALMMSQASSYPDLEIPSLVIDYPAPEQSIQSQEQEQEQESPDIEQTFQVKRALTLLSRLAPIRNVFRPQQEETNRHFDSRSFRPRWHTNINERAPGPLRWG